MAGYTFQLHRAIFRQHILMAPTELCLLMSIVRVDVHHHHHHSQFLYFENASFLPNFILRLLSLMCDVCLLV
jgi:hypothetical protein